MGLDFRRRGAPNGTPERGRPAHDRTGEMGAARKRFDESLIVGDSAEMAAVVEQVEEAAAADTPVLIEGEPGTGRELVARTIHYAGSLRGADFVSVTATTIPKRLLSDELFGTRSGTLRRASGGTLLVKDVDALPPGPQRGLARVLRRGSAEHVDVRVMGASDGDLSESVAASFF